MNSVDRTADYSGTRWRGKVVSVMDPKKQGRIQVRVIGLHDNKALIPDKELPWALVRIPMGAGASVRGVSASPVGVIPGSMVDGYFADSDRTTLIATGTLVSAGQTKTGQTVDGSYALDSDYNDIANSARGQDLNAALGLRNLPALSQIGAVFPAVSAGVGSMPTHSGNILGLVSEADPYNMSGSMSGSVTGFGKSYALNSLMSTASSYAGGLFAIAGVLGQAQMLISQGVPEAQAIAAMPTQLQTLVTNSPGGIIQLLSLANTLSNINPTALLGTAVGSLMNQAVNLASVVGSGFSSSVNDAIAKLGTTKKQREFAIEASEPTPPPTPEPPTTTSSKATTTPAATPADPWGQIETFELPPVVTTAEVLNTNIQEAVPFGSQIETEVIDANKENTNITEQIQAQMAKEARETNVYGGRFGAAQRRQQR